MNLVVFFAIFLVNFVPSYHCWQSIRRIAKKGRSSSARFLNINDEVPSGTVDIVTGSLSEKFASFREDVSFKELLKTHAKAIVFALPGAYNPLCSARHLPGFVQNAAMLREVYGVDAIYCVSVNDKYVLKAWGESTKDWRGSGVDLVADGNAEFVKAVGYIKDVSRFRMSIRSRRWASIVEHGVVKWFELDGIGICDKSSAENVIRYLKS